MMSCKTYIFKLTSGQLAQAPLGTKVQARMHIWMCSRCRAFTHNDKALSGIMASYREHLRSPDK